jgi:excisionase family DNA binding protein
MPENLKGEMISTNDAAKELNITAMRVRALISAGRLPAQKIGRDWIIRRVDLDFVRVRKPGRPPKK